MTSNHAKSSRASLLTSSRRTFLGGLGASAVALGAASAGVDWLLPFRGLLSGRASAGPPAQRRRLIIAFSPNGTIHDEWTPRSEGGELVFGRILSPLARHRARLQVLSGIALRSAERGPGDEHQRGIAHVLTAMPLLPGGMSTGCTSCPPVSWASGPSIDQVIADRIGHGTRYRSLELGAACGIAESVKTRLAYRGASQPLPPEASPWRAWARLFGDAADPEGAMARLRARRSVLDFDIAELERERARLAPSDRPMLERHLETLRELELRLSAPGPEGDHCAPPELGAPEPDLMSPAAYPRIVGLQNDLMVMAMACGLTNVGTILWNHSVGDQTFPHLGVHEPHHTLSHRPDSDSDARELLIRINAWYAEQLASLLDGLEATPDGDGTMLDNTLVVWVNELGVGNVHSLDRVPFVVAGNVRDDEGAPQFRTGRHLAYEGAAHGDLWVSVLRAYGIEASTFGDPEFCSGPLPGLLG